MNSPVPPVAQPSAAMRRVVLGAAFVLALTVCLAPKSSPVHAQEAQAPTGAQPGPRPVPSASSAAKASGDTRISISPRGIEVKTPTTADESADPEADAPSTDASGGRTITIEKGRKRIHVTGAGGAHEFDSINDIVDHGPPAAMVVAIVAVVFLSPVLVVALILGYRMRRARMLNETMLRLAEKGIVPPAEAMNALTGGGASVATATGAAPLYEQAQQLRRHAAWSDLRKGVILGGIGLGLTSFSMLDDGTPNSIGLILLFVGAGYLVLWWFEQRQPAPGSNAGGGSGPAA